MSIQRYDMWTCFDSDIARMMEGEDGEYVKHDEARDHFAMDEGLLGPVIGALQIAAKQWAPANHVAGLEDLAERLRAYREQIAQDVGAKVCIWSSDGTSFCGGLWHTSCDNAFEINEGPPSENGMKFCCYCGSSIEEDCSQ